MKTCVKRRIVNEIGISTTGVLVAVCHYLFGNNWIVTYMTGCLFLLSTFSWYFYEVKLDAFIQYVTSFRGFVITSSIIIIFIFNILERLIISSLKHEPMGIVVLLQFVWLMAILTLASCDCVPNISNGSRLCFPIIVVTNCAYNIYIIKNDINTGVDHKLFSYKNGTFTMEEVELAATMELMLFCFTLLFSVPRDSKHDYFAVLNTRIERQYLINNCNMNHEDVTQSLVSLFECTIRIFYVYIFMAVIGIILTILTMTNIYIWWINSILTAILVLLTSVLIKDYFNFKIIKYLITQFRFGVLSICLIFILYITVQKLIWNGFDEKIYIENIFNYIAYTNGVLLILCRDGMKIRYPLTFTILLSMVLLIVSAYNIFNVMFLREPNKYPNWFVIIEKTSFYQVIVLSILTMCNLFRDKEFRYFILIRQKLKRKLYFQKITGIIRAISFDQYAELSMIEHIDNESFDHECNPNNKSKPLIVLTETI